MLSAYEKKCAAWIAMNRGILSKIADQVKPKVTPQYVHLILYGKRKSRMGSIERLLKKHGAPTLVPPTTK